MDAINYSYIFDNEINVFLTQVDSFWDSQYPESRKHKIKEAFNLKNKVIVPNQIHSDIVINISNKTSESIDCDAIIFESKFVGAINVADCVPICIYDFKNKIIALVHSGWRGTKKNIVLKTINRLERLGCNRKYLKIFLGPSIRGCCYEVEESFAQTFESCAIINRNQKYFVDLSNQIKFSLKKENIPLENIYISNKCTFENQSLHSFRRDGDMAGRMSLIAYKK